VIALSGVSSQAVDIGSAYEFTGINTYSVNGVEYTLTSVTVNNTALSDVEFATVTGNDSISGMANGNVEIALYYSVSENTEGSAE
jgi:hypothetical protein